MRWMYPDFEETGLLYHWTDPVRLPSIFTNGLRANHPDHVNPEENYSRIYEVMWKHRPDDVPDWVDPRHCVFAVMNHRRPDDEKAPGGKPVVAHVGISVTDEIARRSWVAHTAFADWVYHPEAAGYFDTPERTAFYNDFVEPTCARAYWRTSLSFERNLVVRHDHLQWQVGYVEVLICMDPVPPERLSLESVGVVGQERRACVLRSQCADEFARAEARLRRGEEPTEELDRIADCVR